MRALYLLNLDGLRYGVWKDQVESVTKVATIHRLPFSPENIAGLAVLNGRKTALADLASLIGLGLTPFNRDFPGYALLVAGKETGTGFIVSGEIEEVSAHPDSVHVMPGYLNTADVPTCIDYDQKPVPIIDLESLYQRTHSSDTSPAVPSFSVAATQDPGPPAITRLRLFKAGGELFAFPENTDARSFAMPGRVAPIPQSPEYLKGLACHDGNMFPVIHMARKMDLPLAGDPEHLLTAEIGGEMFGFLVDEDMGVLLKSDCLWRPLPPIMESSYFSALAVHAGQIVPIIDPVRFLGSTGARRSAEGASADKYTPESRFDSLFRREDVMVREFTLLGVLHAVPKSEIEDVLPLRPFRKLPGAKSIMIGVAEHQEDVIPVLDLAMVFGRRSLTSSEWSMILVRNGDFRAFFVTETVHGERQLATKIQKKVPVSLPRKLVYGCYPEGDAVRLIFNIEALAVHFDESIIKEFLTAMTKEMAAAPAEIIEGLLSDEDFAAQLALLTEIEETLPSRQEEMPDLFVTAAGLEAKNETDDRVPVVGEATTAERLQADEPATPALSSSSAGSGPDGEEEAAVLAPAATDDITEESLRPEAMPALLATPAGAEAEDEAAALMPIAEEAITAEPPQVSDPEIPDLSVTATESEAEDEADALPIAEEAITAEPLQVAEPEIPELSATVADSEVEDETDDRVPAVGEATTAERLQADEPATPALSSSSAGSGPDGEEEAAVLAPAATDDITEESLRPEAMPALLATPAGAEAEDEADALPIAEKAVTAEPLQVAEPEIPDLSATAAGVEVEDETDESVPVVGEVTTTEPLQAAGPQTRALSVSPAGVEPEGEEEAAALSQAAAIGDMAEEISVLPGGTIESLSFAPETASGEKSGSVLAVAGKDDDTALVVELKNLAALKRTHRFDRKKREKRRSTVFMALVVLLLAGGAIFYYLYPDMGRIAGLFIRVTEKQTEKATIISNNDREKDFSSPAVTPATDVVKNKLPEAESTITTAEVASRKTMKPAKNDAAANVPASPSTAAIIPKSGMEPTVETLAGMELVKNERPRTAPVAQEKNKRSPRIIAAIKKKKYVIFSPEKLYQDSQLYIIKKGDTLWGISKEFTGDPFNYPMVAKENDIPNPDLIFPKQKIYLQKVEIEP